MLLDSQFTNTSTAILTSPEYSGKASGSTGISLLNVGFTGVKNPIMDSSGSLVLNESRLIINGSTASVESYTLGNVYAFGDEGYSASFFEGLKRDPALTAAGTAAGLPHDFWYTQSMPQYIDTTADYLVHIRWFATGKLHNRGRLLD